MTYCIARWSVAESTSEVAMELLCDEDNQPLLFVHRIDAEDYHDASDVDVEMFVIETPEGMSGVVIF